MTKEGYTGSGADAVPRSIGAVITICSHRKKIRPASIATAVSLPYGPQELVESAWQEKLHAERPVVTAQELYRGRGFCLAVQAAKTASAKLYVLSAGLGLIAATQKIPTYGLTVSRGREESVASKIWGEFDSGKWFGALLDNAYSNAWPDVIGRPGRILISLTCPYAEMVGESLLKMGPTVLSRLRLFGASLSTVLPTTLRPAIAPYDTRLDAVLPGTRADFSQRALLHFVNLVALMSGPPDRDADFAAVEAAMKTAAPPDRRRRPRRTDEEILRLISVRLDTQVGIGRVLRALRDEEGVACEQARFSRLYRIAIERRTTA